jgi:cell division protein FtsB
MPKLIFIILLLLLLYLQLQFWWGEAGLHDLFIIQEHIAKQQLLNAKLQQRNQDLILEVEDLKYQLNTVEEYARMELGLIKQGEVFYQIVE